MPLDTAWIALSLVPRIGNKTLDALLATFETCTNILDADKKDLMQVRGVGEKTASAITAIELETLNRDLDRWQQAGIQIITRDADNYPHLLHDLDDKPLTLFIRGNYQPEQWQPAVAIVGSRRATTMSLSKAKLLAEGYADKGWTVISGLALGIDTSAHQGALSSGNMPTLAVLGGGVLNIYPPQNKALAERILDKGAIISENAPNATAVASRLVTRNRIISGLCHHVIIVQSDSDGGAMYAAKVASKLGRDLKTLDFAFSGNQVLIAQGAEAIDRHHYVIPSPINP